MAGGRPPKFESVDSLQKQIYVYFAKCDQDDEPYTITGLAAIFALKNFGWKDKQETELSGKDGKPIETTSEVRITFVDSKHTDSESV